jgi:hypothetical protein|tara:strand:- start:559 stop:786 length:228 start_codon:yes stop_codon:yes gene_type:complete
MKPTLTNIKKIIKKAHPDMTGLKVTWVKRPFWLHEPKKASFEGWWSLVKIEADGYASSVKPASVDACGAARLYIG